MAYLTMPVRTDLPCYQFQVALETVIYTLDFEWNERGQFWTMHISDENEVPMFQGIRLITGVPFLDKYYNTLRPPGDFYCFDTSGSGVDPGISDLGTRVLLIYRESTTVDT